jgi:hypothetical protein
MPGADLLYIGNLSLESSFRIKENNGWAANISQKTEMAVILKVLGDL